MDGNLQQQRESPTPSLPEGEGEREIITKTLTITMTKREIFDKIVFTCAEVCEVNIDDIINGCRKEDVSTARALLVLWADAAGFTTESMVKLCECNNANSINAVRARIETLWVERYSFHILAYEVGRRLLTFAHSIGEDFDIYKPLKRMSKATGKY